MINFNVPPFTGKEFDYMKEAVSNLKICGDGPFTKKCDAWMEERFKAKKVLLTTSDSHFTRRISVTDIKCTPCSPHTIKRWLKMEIGRAHV